MYLDASISPLNLSLGGAASMIQSLGGFAVDLKYGEFSSQWYDDSDGMVTYGIGFGGSISLPIKAPKKKEVTYETSLGKAQEIDFTKYDDDMGESLKNLFDESLTADQEDISVFGRERGRIGGILSAHRRGLRVVCHFLQMVTTTGLWSEGCSPSKSASMTR